MSAKNNNKLNVPEARSAMDKFKMEAASEVGVNLKEGYNGDLTSREAGLSPTRSPCKHAPESAPPRQAPGRCFSMSRLSFPQPALPPLPNQKF